MKLERGRAPSVSFKLRGRYLFRELEGATTVNRRLPTLGLVERPEGVLEPVGELAGSQRSFADLLAERGVLRGGAARGVAVGLRIPTFRRSSWRTMRI